MQYSKLSIKILYLCPSNLSSPWNFYFITFLCQFCVFPYRWIISWLVSLSSIHLPFSVDKAWTFLAIIVLAIPLSVLISPEWPLEIFVKISGLYTTLHMNAWIYHNLSLASELLFIHFTPKNCQTSLTSVLFIIIKF